MTTYIFLNGPQQSGRSTIAEAFYRTLNSVTLVPWADAFSLSMPLKTMFQAGLGQTWGEISGQTPRAVLNGLSGQEALLKLRIHIRAIYGPDILARWLEHRVIGRAAEKLDYIIVDDLKFQEDYDWFAPHRRVLIHAGKNKGGFVWLPEPDYTIGNFDSVGRMYEQVKQIVTEIIAHV